MPALLRRCGATWLIPDRNGVLQPHNLRRAGSWNALAGRVRIDVHKEQMLSDIHQTCGADHGVMADDKLRILHAIKQQWHQRAATVQPMQGHDGNSEPKGGEADWADITGARIELQVEGDCARSRAGVRFAPDLQNMP